MQTKRALRAELVSFGFSSAALVVLILTGCGDGNNGNSPTLPQPSPTVTSVSVSCTPAAVEVNKTSQCSAKVFCSGSGNCPQGVSWSASVGTIDANGLFTAPGTPGDATVMATASGTVVSGKTTITITPPPPPPDRIAFWQNGPLSSTACGGLCEDIYSINPDGSDKVQLTTNPAQDLEPAWSPDRMKIAFTTNRDGDQAIYVMNADGSNQTRVQSGLPYSTWPNWSPDGGKIAFIGRFKDEIGVAVMNVDGSQVKQLTHTPCPQGCKAPEHPSWSPDGTKIAFGNPTNGKWQIFVIDGLGNLTNLSNNGSTESDPSYSPDGNYIAFISDRSSPQAGQFELFVMTSDGSRVKQLTFPATGHNDLANAKIITVVEPTWSKDSSQIVFSDTSGLYKISIDGTGLILLTSGRYPSWH